MASGYTNCACRDCFEVTVSAETTKSELCFECEEAGCEANAETECCAEHTYGGDEPMEPSP